MNYCLILFYIDSVPYMNQYPGPNSVLVLDNAKIHHGGEWVSIVEGLGGRVLYLPPYSPNFNPIEIAFAVIKKWLKRHRDFVTTCGQITPDMAKSFFQASIYF